MQTFANPEKESSNIMNQDMGQRASGAAAAGKMQYAASQIRPTALDLLRSYVKSLQEIQLWNAASSSQRLWILGPYQVPQPSPYTHLSAHVVLTAQEAGAPVIFFFGGTTSRVIDLIYTLIVQIVDEVPSQFESTLDFSTARFEAALTGNDDSLGPATRLLQDLISIANTPMLHVVIGGLRMLDRSAETRAQLKEVVAALTTSMNAFATRGEAPGASTTDGKAPQALKMLFTTDGFTDALVELKGGERVNLMDIAGEDDEADGMLVKLTMKQ